MSLSPPPHGHENTLIGADDRARCRGWDRVRTALDPGDKIAGEGTALSLPWKHPQTRCRQEATCPAHAVRRFRLPPYKRIALPNRTAHTVRCRAPGMACRPGVSDPVRARPYGLERPGETLETLPTLVPTEGRRAMGDGAATPYRFRVPICS
jgi:hypothetical protein